MDHNFLFYIFLSFVIATGGTYVLFSSGRIISAIVYLIGIVVLEVIFGMRWFQTSGAKNATIGPWPPSMNVCPDFLSLYHIKGEPVCVDTIGVSTGGMSKWTDATQTDERYLFRLFIAEPVATRTKKLCEQAKLKMVTWEGVWDGTTCLGGQPPVPEKK